MTPQHLYYLRRRARMSQAEMADYLGLKDKSQIAHLESGRTKISGPKLKLLLQLQKSLQISCK